jgi:hypothetical protein
MKPPRSIFRSRQRRGVRDNGPTTACAEHQWQSTLERDDDDDGVYYDYQCRCCPAIGIECQRCFGTKYGYGGVYCSDPERLDRTLPKEVCPRCAGKGIIEIVEITLAEIQRLRAKAGEP